MTTTLTQPLVWIDLEMTGLDPTTDVIVEIAVIVTDGSLDHVIEGTNLVIGATDEQLESMAPVVVEMHAASGLTPEIKKATLTVAEAEQVALEFVRTHVPEPRSAPLAGNSVHADRAFLRAYMPELEGYVHYRNVDVSTIKELARRWYPKALEEEPDKTGNHRALADIRESIEELRYYRSRIFKSTEPPSAQDQSPQ